MVALTATVQEEDAKDSFAQIVSKSSSGAVMKCGDNQTLSQYHSMSYSFSRCLTPEAEQFRRE